MEAPGTLTVDPGTIHAAPSGATELTVAYTEFATTRELMQRAAGLANGLDPRIRLVAVHIVPFPSDFECRSATHSFLVDQLITLSACSSHPVAPEVVLARTLEDGFRHALPAQSTVLIASRRRPWPTWEERLARSLVREGHQVVLVHVE